MSDQVRDAVAAILPDLRDRANQADRDRAIPRASIEELTAAGVFGMFVPSRYGGTESDVLAFLEVVRDVSAACGSTGWLVGWFGVHAWHLGLFPVRAQEDVWGEDRDALLAAAYAATGHVVEVEDGYRLQGRWGWATGCEHADWVLLGGLLTAHDGSPADLVTFLVPAGDLRIERNWDTVGLRATGSHDLIADDVFVPAHRTLSFAPCLEGWAPGTEANPGVLYRLPLPSMFAAVVAASVIGMAEGAYASLVGWLRTRLGMSWSGLSLGSDDFSNARLAAASADVDASWLQLVRDVREIVNCAGDSGPVPLSLRRRIRRDQVVATQRAAAAVDQLFEHSGGEVVRLGNPVEQAWRNIHTTQAHALNDLDRTLAMYGAGELAVDAHPPMV
ncbi:3-hydroxy-9,10-secoandrosta-1,3,5(10)-triene-9,17-dione monooxygenase [Thermomonospora echinospora]|uniref:3-hydroxy-9,10-secoandrosta-1,3,5(10)-triene-9,17-dione monooxygenase n=1 Tax=Thermomonospora echinospora TaxID=1992 RepID=A0A1H6E7H0_9ACTN|nr:3-hydroxy-9,10-secoandrosta-1,3,5(10)-triene-9,17-dione monooxygenase oxygenase subunit [Thermomonospora echinospora]SEG93662.1 3-hydroxy-9,10-secoandrosta-1,3,5(10)-triene-9,17-dione monooxygenase [Thermomonospora echinospora]